MWTKLSGVLRSRQEEEATARPSVDSRLLYDRPNIGPLLLEQHPNLSMFKEERPSSPTTGRLNPFKRASKMPPNDADADGSPLRPPSTIPKRAKSSLSLLSIGSTGSLPRSSHEAARRPSMDSLRTPKTPSSDLKFSSVRSILREPKTPGTGANVRFFSRDATKALDISAEESVEPVELGLEERLEHVSSPPRLTAAEVFSTSFEPVHIDTSNLFDMSAEYQNMPPISPGPNTMLAGAVEVPDDETPDVRATSTPLHKQETIEDTIFNSAEKSLDRGHDRSQSFSFGQTVFFSMNRSNSSDASSSNSTKSPKSRRIRALSDGMFYRPGPSPVVATTTGSRPPSASPEYDINDESSSSLVLYASPPPDPFRADATTYYTPETLIPPTPPRPTAGGTVNLRRASREEDMILSLRNQLALQQELCTQYEVDLSARDQLFSDLSAKLENAELDGHKWRGALRSCKKKVSELQRTCRHLEEEVDTSRQQSFERSVMDEASSEALRHLHRQIGRLEREKDDLQKTHRSEVLKLEETVKERTEAFKKIEDTLRKREESERALRAGIRDAREQMEQMQVLDGEEETKALVIRREQAGEEERERHREVEAAWEEDRATANERNAGLHHDLEQLRAELDGLCSTLTHRDYEYNQLKGELEAQWKDTERATKTIEALTKDKNSLVTERQTLHMEIQSLGSKLSDIEDVKTIREAELEEQVFELDTKAADAEARALELESELQELYEIKEGLEKTRDEIDEQLLVEQEQVDGLTQTLKEQEDRLASLETDLQERESRLTILDQERRFALDTVSRLEENIKQRDADIIDHASRSMMRNSEAEELREELDRANRDHVRVVHQHVRILQEAVAAEQVARSELESLVRAKAGTDVEAQLLRERVSTLNLELDQLRRRIHELQQESADKEVRLVQVQKKAAQDKDDMNGLNIALDSKQQELELLKRKIGVRGTAGSTPAQPSRASSHRRNSSVFSTPSSRPTSALSDVLKESVETPVAVKSSVTLGKSVRGNGVPTSVTKPPRGVEGSMGPPPNSKRTSISGTPSRIPSSSFSRTPSVGGKPNAPLRRVSASMAPGSSMIDGLKPRSSIVPRADLVPPVNEKENLSRSRLRKVPPPPA